MTTTRSVGANVARAVLLAFLASLLVFGAACGRDDPTVEADASAEIGNDEDKAQVATPPTTPGEEGERQTFTKEQSGETAQMEVGEEVVVSLETCPGCGYHWEITSPPDGAVVECCDATETEGDNQADDGTPIAGAPGTIDFKFKGTGAGTASVEIGYFPPGDDKAEETYTLTFVVR